MNTDTPAEDEGDLLDLGDFAADGDGLDEDMLALDELLASHSNVGGSGEEEHEILLVQEDSTEGGDFVPESLASYVRKADEALQEHQQDFLDQGQSKSFDRASELESNEGSPSKLHKIQEDEQDLRLKGEVLDQLEAKKRQADLDLMSPDLLFSPPPNPAVGISDTEAKRQALAGSTPPSATAAATASKPVHINLVDVPDEQDLLDQCLASDSGLVTDEEQLPETNREVKEDPLAQSTVAAPMAQQLGSLSKPRVAVPPPKPENVPHLAEVVEGPDGSPVSTSPGRSTPSPQKPAVPPTPVTTDSVKKSAPEVSAAPVSAQPPSSLEQPTPSPQVPVSTPDVDTPMIAVSKKSGAKTASSKKAPTPSSNTPAHRPQATKTPSPAVSTGSYTTPAVSTSKPSSVSSKKPVSLVDRLSQPTTASTVRAKRAPLSSGNRKASSKQTPSPLSSTKKTPSPVPTTRKTPSPATGKNGTMAKSREQAKSRPLSSSVGRLSRPTSASAKRASPKVQPSKVAKPTNMPKGPTLTTTASSGAPAPPVRKPNSSGSSSLMRGTAASRARSSGSAEKPPSVSAEDGRARARERIRQRELQKKKASTGTGPKPLSSRRTSVSADEGVARARERVRQRQMQHTAATQSRARSSTSSYRPTTAASSKPRSVTVPQAPRFATDARHGEKHVSGSAPPPLAQSSDIFGKGLRHDSATRRSLRSGKPPRLTIPKAPNFATTARHGEKIAGATNGGQPPLAQSSDAYARGLRDDHSVGSAGSAGSRRSLTRPKSPNFTTTARHGAKTPSIAVQRSGSSRSVTLAQSTDVLKRGLRSSRGTVSAVKRTPGPTIPHGPRFHQSAQRALPQSTAEKERELMDYHKSHPFRATPIMTQAPASTRATHARKRSLTTPQPFHLRTDDRHNTAKPPEGSSHQEEEDLKEMKKQFHARPMPTFAQPTKSQATRAKLVARHATKPRPFRLASESRTRTQHSPTAQDADDIEMAKKFLARPAPRSTYHAPPPLQKSPRTDSTLGPPQLATESRAGKRQAVMDASHHSADAKMREKEEMALMRQREKHAEAILKAEATTPPPATEPFVLESSLRHEAYQKRMAEKLKEEEAERRRQMDFHAREFTSPPTPERIRTDTRTQAEPFALQSMARHEAFEQERKRQLAAEEEERKRQAAFKARAVPKSTYVYAEPFALQSMARHEAFEQERKRQLAAEEEERKLQATFKARAVPKSTYVYKPISPKAGELVDPFSPQLQSKHRAEERKEYDEYAKKERETEAARKKAFEEQKAAEEEEDIQERRRLPVEEGGMIPSAKPVNAVFAPAEGSVIP